MRSLIFKKIVFNCFRFKIIQIVFILSLCILLILMLRKANQISTNNPEMNISIKDTNNFNDLGNSDKLDNVSKILKFYESIKISERHVFSQNADDGVIQMLIEFIKIPKVGGYYVEFGTENASQCNTRYLREKFKWNGLLMDGSNQNSSINLNKEIILYSNILELFRKYNVPVEMDIFSEDTDYADYWIVEEVLKIYRPRIVIHEVNQQPGNICVTVPKTDQLNIWEDGSNFHGASVCAFYCLAKRNKYTMVYCEKTGVNCFWLRNDLLEKNLKISASQVQRILNPFFLYQKPFHVYYNTGKTWTHIYEC